MQMRMFAIPLMGGEALQEDLNHFLRSKQILQVESVLVLEQSSHVYAVQVRYIENGPSPDLKRERFSGVPKNKPDYMEELEPEQFKKFARLRDIRKQLAKSEAIPAYQIFTNAELAKMAEFPVLTLEAIGSIL